MVHQAWLAVSPVELLQPLAPDQVRVNQLTSAIMPVQVGVPTGAMVAGAADITTQTVLVVSPTLRTIRLGARSTEAAAAAPAVMVIHTVMEAVGVAFSKSVHLARSKY